MKDAYYEFFCPVKLIVGARALENIPFELGALGASRPLVVTDRGVAGAGLVDTLREVLAAGGRVLNLLDLSDVYMTFFVPDAAAVDLDRFGPAHEHHPLYPQRTNVEIVQVVSDSEIILRIWERGTGITLASGSCSCAAVVAAARRGLTGRRARVNVPGGVLEIDWREDGVWMTGPTAHVFDGVWRG